MTYKGRSLEALVARLPKAKRGQWQYSQDLELTHLAKEWRMTPGQLARLAAENPDEVVQMLAHDIVFTQMDAVTRQEQEDEMEHLRKRG